MRKIHIRIHGATADLLADVSDETPLAVPAPWADLPVMPALVRWRIGSGAWTTAVDYRLNIPSAAAFSLFTTGRPGRTTRTDPAYIESVPRQAFL